MEQTIEITERSVGMEFIGDIANLLKRLSLLGYRSYHLRMIFREAIGAETLNEATPSQYREIVHTLAKYEQLAADYLQTYSK